MKVTTQQTQCPTTMAGKPVLYREAKTVLTLDSLEFQEKGLCDGITLNPGDACVFGCTYCYVEGAMLKVVKPIITAHNQAAGINLS